MKYLTSIGWRLLAQTSTENVLNLIEKYDINQQINGIEIATTVYSDLLLTLNYCIKKNLEFQCHSPLLLKDNNVYKYLDDIDTLSKIKKNTINIVFHSIECDNIQTDILETTKYLTNILTYIEKRNLNITISLENLNYHHNHFRINLNCIDEVLKEFKKIKFTYDIGHDIYDNRQITPLTQLQENKLNNIHIHNIKENQDHCVIYTNCECITQLQKSIQYLKSIHYNNNIVIESAVDFYDGNTINDKLITYIKSFEAISNILEKE